MKMVIAPAANISLMHVDVGGEARDQAADRVAVEEAHRQLLHVREELDAQVGEAALRHQHRQVVLQVEEARTRRAWRAP